MKTLYAFLTILVLSLLSSCKDPGPVSPSNQEPDPFANGSSDRNLILVVSDLHLGVDLTFAETSKNLPYLEKFLETVRVSPIIKELVLAGDILDEWFVPANLDTYNGKDQHDFVQRIAAANKGVVDAFNRIIQEGKIKVTYVPGNHDLGITAANLASIFPGINQSRDEVQGVGTYSPDGLSEIAIEHGHRYNFFCAPDPVSNKNISPGSMMPAGYFFTRLAALHVVQNCTTPVDTLPAVTANLTGGDSQNAVFIYWKVWSGLMTQFPIKNRFDEKILVTNIHGFTEKYAVNDIIPYQLSPGGKIDMNLFKGIQDNWNERQIFNKVPVNIPLTQAIALGADNNETVNEAKIQYFMNPNSNKRLVVFGHTHDPKILPFENLKGQKAIYANSGTWIDHNPNRTTMNFVVITPQNSSSTSQTYVKLYNYEGAVFTKMSADSLRF